MSHKSVHTMQVRPSTLRKYEAIHARYQHLYNVERKRIDDVETQLCNEFFLSRTRVLIILKMELK